MEESTVCTSFHKSPCCVQDLRYDEAAGPIQVEVTKAIELTEAQYRHFSSHMLEDMPFIAANSDLTGCDEKGVVRCLLVYDRKRRDGILVDSQGCDYARYAASEAPGTAQQTGAGAVTLFYFEQRAPPTPKLRLIYRTGERPRRSGTDALAATSGESAKEIAGGNCGAPAEEGQKTGSPAKGTCSEN